MPIVSSSDDWSELGTETACIGLHSGRSGGFTKTGLSFTVDDLEATARRVEEAGGRVIELSPDLGGFRLGEFVDTEQNFFMASGK